MATEASTVVGSPDDSKVNLGMDGSRQPSGNNDSDALALQKDINDTDIEKASSHSINPASAENEADSSTPEDSNIVSWDGPDDPENPMNWTAKKKFINVATVSLITFLTYGIPSPVSFLCPLTV